MNNVKLSDSQKMLLSKLRIKQMKLVKAGDLKWYDWCNHKGNIPYVTAIALLNKGMFTIDKDGTCHLTELGKTIEF